MTDVPWLDDEEQRTWRLYQAMSRVLEAALDRELQRNAGMPHGYYAILAILASAPKGSRRITALAETTSSSQSRVSHAISALEQRGWVRKERCTDDTRGTLAVLTAAGRQALKAAAPGHVRQVRASVFDQLTKTQVHQLGQICERVLLALDDDRVVRSPFAR